MRELQFPEPEKQADFAEWDLDQLSRELTEVQHACEASSSPVVCSHNDLLSGNIMVPREVRV